MLKILKLFYKEKNPVLPYVATGTVKIFTIKLRDESRIEINEVDLTKVQKALYDQLNFVDVVHYDYQTWMITNAFGLKPFLFDIPSNIQDDDAHFSSFFGTYLGVFPDSDFTLNIQQIILIDNNYKICYLYKERTALLHRVGKKGKEQLKRLKRKGIDNPEIECENHRYITTLNQLSTFGLLALQQGLDTTDDNSTSCYLGR